jgi:hypothetical protein
MNAFLKQMLQKIGLRQLLEENPDLSALGTFLIHQPPLIFRYDQTPSYYWDFIGPLWQYRLMRATSTNLLCLFESSDPFVLGEWTMPKTSVIRRGVKFYMCECYNLFMLVCKV